MGPSDYKINDLCCLITLQANLSLSWETPISSRLGISEHLRLWRGHMSLCLSSPPGSLTGFSQGPHVHPSDGFPGNLERQRKMQPRHLTNALTSPALLKGGIRHDISKVTVFSWGNFKTAKTLMTLCVRKGPRLSFRPDVNFLAIHHVRQMPGETPVTELGCLCRRRTLSGTRSLTSACR